ncbi:MAG: TonB-dependent receptor [Caulobacter sp.]|nr:TonB-dependent receptor [Caulobacter sp.]
MIRTLLATTCLASLALATGAHADDQQAAAPDVAAANTLDGVVVTATRSPQRTDKIGSMVTVLDAAAIRASQALVTVDLLAQTPGVSFTRNGGPGASTTVNIRGAEGQHTVVLIDGVKLNDPSSTQGGFNFGNLLIGDTARIEVLRGAQSTLWGSQAIGGVVNIITAEPTQPLEASIDAEGGARATASLRAGLGGKVDKLSWRIAGAYYTTDGFSAYAPGKEDDGYQNTGASGRVRYDLSDAVSVEARAVYSEGKVDIDGFGVDSAEYSKTKELVTYAGLNVALLDGRLKNRLAFAYTDTDRGSFNPAQAVTPRTFDAAGQNQRWEYQGSFAITDTWSAVFGAESEKAKMRTRSPSSFTPNPAFGRGKADINGVYAQLQGEVVKGLTLTAGLRHDDHDTYGGKTLGQLAAAWALNDGSTVLRASFGQGFRAPGLFELYSEFGNLQLEPEKFDSWEAGVEQKLIGGRAVVSATYFNRQADNEIRFFSCSTGSTDPLCRGPNGAPRFGYYDNVFKTKTQGVELIGSLKVTDALSLQGNYSWTDAENATPGAQKGKKLVRRPETMANASATYVWPIGLTTTVAARHVGKTFDNAANTTVVKAYTVVDLRASYPINDTLEMFGRVENATDEVYQTIRNYGSPGRGAFVGLRARF